MELKALSLAQMEALYHTSMTADFPQAELRPFSCMAQLWQEGSYLAYGYCEDDTILAYACFAQAMGVLLLDFYAVDASLRGQGVGSTFFSLLQAQLAGDNAPPILIEVESVESARCPEEKTLRERRIRFYENCGCQMSQVVSRLFGVEFSIMFYPMGEFSPTDADLLIDLMTVHRPMARLVVGDSPEAFEKVCSVWIK